MSPRCILDTMTTTERKLFTIPLSLEQLVGIHVAAEMLEDRKATQLVYNYIKKKISEAKALSLTDYERMCKEKKPAILERSKRKAEERQKIDLQLIEGGEQPTNPQNNQNSHENGSAVQEARVLPSRTVSRANQRASGSKKQGKK